jgi:hypothetical protein
VGIDIRDINAAGFDGAEGIVVVPKPEPVPFDGFDRPSDCNPRIIGMQVRILPGDGGCQEKEKGEGKKEAFETFHALAPLLVRYRKISVWKQQMLQLYA